MDHVSPSRLGQTEACPRFSPDPSPSDVADAGTLYHSIMEQLAEAHEVSTWNSVVEGMKVSPDTRGLVQESVEAVAGYFGAGLKVDPNGSFTQASKGIPPGIYPECAVETWPGKKGYIDLLVVMPGSQEAVIVDYKSSRAEHDYDLQLGAYAAAVTRANGRPFAHVTCRIVAPRLDPPPDLVLAPKDVEAFEERIRTIDAAAHNPFTPARAGDQCAFCEWNGKCPAQASAIRTLAPVESAAAELPQRVLLNPATPKERALRRDFVTWMGGFIEKVKEDDKELFSRDPNAVLPGYKVVRSRGHSSLDKSRMDEVFDKLRTSYGWTDDVILQVSNLDRAKLVELVRVSGVLKPGGESADAVCDGVLDEFMSRGADIVSLRRIPDSKRAAALPTASPADAAK